MAIRKPDLPARAAATALESPARVPRHLRNLTVALAAGGLISILMAFFILYEEAAHDHLSVGEAVAGLVCAYVVIFAAGLWIFMRYGMPLVTAQTEQLQRAFEAEREVSRRQADFLVHVHHELRTPVTVVLGATELLNAHGDDIPAEQRFKLRAAANHHAKSLAKLVEDLVHGVDEALPGLGSDVPANNWTSQRRN